MDPARDETPMYQCPCCQDRAPFPVRCDRCDRQMTVSGDEEPLSDTTDEERCWRVVGPMIGVGATWSLFAMRRPPAGVGVAASMTRELVWAAEWLLSRSILLAGPWLLVVVVTLLGVGLGSMAARAKIRASRRWRRRSHGLAAMAEVPRGELHRLGPGPVRVRAMIAEALPVLSARGVICAACEALDDGGGSPRPRHPQGGRFTLRDAEGRRVAVDARWVQVVEGCEFDEETHVPVGAMIEIVATCRARVADGTVGSYRDAARDVELVGSPAAPVLLRVLRPPWG
ncbi:MAG: hypothetical protein U0325_34390 [Polyangiales bacterium]